MNVVTVEPIADIDDVRHGYLAEVAHTGRAHGAPCPVWSTYDIYTDVGKFVGEPREVLEVKK